MMSRNGSDAIPPRRHARTPLSTILAKVLLMDMKARLMIKKAGS